MLEKLQTHLEKNHIFLTGGGGVGKSYLTSELIKSYREKGKKVVVLGSTGISAVHVGGQTLHSFFVLGIANSKNILLKNDRYNKNRLKDLYQIVENCDLLVIDEISMVSAAVMEMVYFRLIQGKFSGRVLFVGDFFQLPPIKNRDQKSTTKSLFKEPLYAFESSAWGALNPKAVFLRHPKRTQDKVFFSVLNAIREGQNSEKVLKYLYRLSQNRHIWEQNPTVLFGRNREADKLNSERLSKLKAPTVNLKAKESIHDNSLNIKRFDAWKRSLPVPEEMALKIGARVLFCTNKWGRYMNGEQGIVREIEADSVWVEKNESLVEVQRHTFNFQGIEAKNSNLEEVPLATLEQFPLKLAYAITIHKSQGMSIDSLVCNIDNIFEASQFYVAISRAKYPGGLLIESSKIDLDRHLKRCIRVDENVRDFYANLSSINLD